MLRIPEYETEKSMTFGFHIISFLLMESPCLILFCVRITVVRHRTCFLDSYAWKQTPLLVHSWVRISLWSKDRPEPLAEVVLLSGLRLHSDLPPTALCNVSFHCAHRLSSSSTAHSCDGGTDFKENSYCCDNGRSYKHCHHGSSSSAPEKRKEVP